MQNIPRLCQIPAEKLRYDFLTECRAVGIETFLLEKGYPKRFNFSTSTSSIRLLI